MSFSGRVYISVLELSQLNLFHFEQLLFNVTWLNPPRMPVCKVFLLQFLKVVAHVCNEATFPCHDHLPSYVYFQLLQICVWDFVCCSQFRGALIVCAIYFDMSIVGQVQNHVCFYGC